MVVANKASADQSNKYLTSTIPTVHPLYAQKQQQLLQKLKQPSKENGHVHPSPFLSTPSSSQHLPFVERSSCTSSSPTVVTFAAAERTRNHILIQALHQLLTTTATTPHINHIFDTQTQLVRNKLLAYITNDNTSTNTTPRSDNSNDDVFVITTPSGSDAGTGFLCFLLLIAFLSDFRVLSFHFVHK